MLLVYHTSSATVYIYIVIFVTIIMGDGKCYLITFELFYCLSSHHFFFHTNSATSLSAVHLAFNPHTFKTQLDIHTQTHKGCCIRMEQTSMSCKNS